MPPHLDAELEEFRRVMEVPSQFEEGFRWSSLVGALFVALLMVPGALYMSLLAGAGSIGPASRWVTVILFVEIARRAQRHLRRAEIFVLFFMAGAAMSMPFSGLLWNQFFARSDAARATGIAEQLPRWFAPSPESGSYAQRSFLHWDWLPVVGMVIFGSFFSQLSSAVLGYGLFRLTSDVEELPFPLAPVGAQGIMALAEDVDATEEQKRESSWRWRVFAIGGALGLAFGAVYTFLPTVTGALTGSANQILPIPFSDFTAKTGQFLPAVATGLSWDLGNLLAGMVMPFFAMVGAFIGLVVTVVANPVLYSFGILTNWKPGDDTVTTLFKNNVDFYFSFTIGVSFAVALFGFYQMYRGLRRHLAEARAEGRSASPWKAAKPPTGRGDIRTPLIIACYFIVTITYIAVSAFLLRWHHHGWTPGIARVVGVLCLLGFVYTPLISYATARLEGMVGQVVEIPMVKEISLILSGYRGVAVWFLPIPLANYGQMTVHYRQCELTGTKFTSLWKTQVVLYPIILVSSILFASFIWSLDEVPSAAYPFADKMWPLQANNTCITYSATLGEYSMFEAAFDWRYLACGTGFGVVLFSFMSTIGAPIMMAYGVVRGLGQTMPHSVLPQFIGALIGRYYFHRRLGLRWRQYIPVVMAGFGCGVGLITTLGVGITFLSKSMIKLPF
jgi:hypothetical protein